MFRITVHRLLLALLGALVPLIGSAQDVDTAAATPPAGETFTESTIIKEAADFLGAGAEGVGEVLEKVFADLGRPNAYIEGEEASGAIGVGARYGNGTLKFKSGGSRTVHWTGPSIGFDAGANVSKVFVLVYNLADSNALFQRFPAVDGSIYVVGGISANYHQSGNIVLAPVRLGAGLRAGINVGYMKYTAEKTWNPF
ncbi:MAG: DUF1134 domain-containing protein [Gammaproteobacteria bacterium]|nr:DUF1134 domain-containing protein [Gammaproteobacteria bacterium]